MALTHPAGQPGAAESIWERAASCFAEWRAGDTAALDHLVRCLTPVLWHVVRAYGLSQAAAEDAVQSTWLALVRSKNQISEPAAVGGWLLTTARRTAWRMKATESRSLPVDDVDLAYALPPSAGAESTALEALDASDLWSLVATLDERCQRLLRVVAFDTRPNYAQLANDLNMPLGSIGPTRRRCLDKLRASLQKGEQS